MDSEWNNYINKKVKTVYDDGNRITTKKGILKNVGKSFLILKTEEGDEAISTSRIIRMELTNGDSQ